MIERHAGCDCSASMSVPAWETTTHLRAVGRLRNQPAQRRQQVGMEARLRLVEHEQSRRARREESRDPQQVAERAVGELGGLQRPQAARAAPSRARTGRCCSRTATRLPGKRIVDGLIERSPGRRSRGSSAAPRPGPNRRGSAPAYACRFAGCAPATWRLRGSDRRNARRASPRAASASRACSADRRSASSCCRSSPAAA